MTSSAIRPKDLLHVRKATAVGGTAVVMWATLALFATLSEALPPFQTVAMAFFVAFLVGAVWSASRGRSALAHLRQPWPVWALGVGGLFGYHFFYFLAFRLAPEVPVEINLLNYLWPLLIVVFSALLPGERLRWWHAAGALAGLGGTALLVTRGGEGISAEAAHLPGYAAALAAALTWGGYSVLSRRFGDVPTDAVGGFCLATAVLAGLCHLVFEETVAPDAATWGVVALMGLGPVGASFFVWDHGVKHGDIRALGAFAYAAPLLSTLLLLAFGQGEADGTVWAACAMIVGGAVLASRDLLRRRAPAAPADGSKVERAASAP